MLVSFKRIAQFLTVPLVLTSLFAHEADAQTKLIRERMRPALAAPRLPR